MPKKSEIKAILDKMSPKSRYSSAKGGYVFKLYYFYRVQAVMEQFDRFEKDLVKTLTDRGLKPKVVKTSEHYNKYPKQSWFEVVIAFEEG